MAPALDNVVDAYPLTPMQLGMVYHTIADPSSGVFVNQIRTELVGSLDVDRFRRAWAGVVAAEPILRTAFVWDGLDEPLQVVRGEVDVPWTVHHEAIEGDVEAHIQKLLEEDRATPIDLARAPLMRMTLQRTAGDRWEWIWTMHHVIADGWSAQLVLDRVFEAYRTDVQSVDPSPDSFRSAVTRSAGSDVDATFWRGRLAGFTEPHRLEVPGLPVDQDATGYATHDVELDAATTAALRRTAAGFNVTLNTVVLGAWLVVLSRWMRTTDVVTGVTVSGRNAPDAGIRDAIGLFINTLPMRMGVAPADRLAEWLPRLQRNVLDLQDHEHSSLAAVQKLADIPAGEALFESIFVFENYPPSSSRDPGPDLAIGRVEHIEQSNYPLAVLALPGDQLTLALVHDTGRLSEAAVTALAHQMVVVLSELATRAPARIGDLRTVSDGDAERIAALESGPDLVDDERSMTEVIRSIARQRPEHPAVRFQGSDLTYGELLQRADALATRLHHDGIEPDTPVGLYTHRSMELAVGILGIMNAGAAYVPLDPSYPDAHIEQILDGSGIRHLVTTSDLADSVPGDVSVTVVDGRSPAASSTDPPDPASNDRLAYVIHTSGSTGQPKGVMVTHRNLVRSTAARAVHYGAGVDRFLLLSSFSFDSSIVGIFWTLATGGTLVLPEPDMEQDAEAILDLAATEHATHLLCLPALYRVLLDQAEGRLDDLRVAMVAGEACPPGILDLHIASLSETELHNEYGPTEATVWATAHRAGPADLGVPLPIGRPIAGTSIHLLDPSGHRVALGFAGELCISGGNVTPGYLGRPDLTAERFVTLPIDGTPTRVYRTGDLAAFGVDGRVVFLGRADRQLKIRGHRIETSAVESAIRSVAGVRDAAAAGYRTAGRSTDQLAAWIVADAALGDDAIRAALGDTLPAHMVPDLIVRIDDLPRLPNGKVDTRALPDPGERRTADERVAPRTEAERVLADIWSDLLGVDDVGVDDDFFALGGDSIVSIQMISRARQAGVPVQPAHIANHPTIAGLARAANEAAGPADGDSGIDDTPMTADVPLGPMQRWFLGHDLADPAHWNQSVLLRSDHAVDLGALTSAIGDVVARHDMLRTRIDRDGQQHIAESVDVPVSLVEVAGPEERSATMRLHQAALDLEDGPLVTLVVMRQTTADDEILIVAHHLVTDAVSWSVILEDLASAYEARRASRTADFPPATVPFGRWIEHLAGGDRSDEVAFWLDQAAEGTIPVDHPGPGYGTEGDRRVVRSVLDEATTDALLTDANEAYGTRVTDLLATGIGRVLTGWTGLDRISILFEGHGRPDHLDLTRTVGWATAAYPVALERHDDDADAIKVTKEQLRAVPDQGIGYGVLRWLQRHPDVAREPLPDVVFNYLGRTTGAGTGPFTRIEGADDTSRSPDNERLHAIEVVAQVDDGRLVSSWQYAATRHDSATIENLAAAFDDALRQLVAHCLGGDGGFTPSDFPEAGLAQDELDDLFEGLA